MTLCEIDRGVIDLCREHFPEISAGAYDDPRTRIVIADGTKFVAETDERFDVIMVDSTDPIGPGAVLFTREFYADCRRCLKPRRPPRHPERAALPAGRASSSRASAFSASCLRTPSPISPPRRAISAAPCPMAGRPTTPSCGTPREDRAPLREGGAPSRRAIGAPRSMSRPSRSQLTCKSWSSRVLRAARASAGSPTSGRQ